MITRDSGTKKKRIYGLQSKIMYQYQFVNCKKWTILMWDVNKRGDWVWSVWEHK